MPERLDEAKTAPFTKGPPLTEAPAAALLLHGFTGSPWELEPVGDSLAARGFHVHCPRLPGHGTTPEAMLFAGMTEWLATASQSLDAMRGARRLVVVGLSMGALLAMVLASRFQARISGLVLIAPALRLRSRQARALKKLRWVPGLDVRETWLTKTS
ncbi:MAG TPA: alpha/beta fold hydrolase, partial [Archangium sp.]